MILCYMPRLTLRLYQFRLLWNGQAMLDWNTSEQGAREVNALDPAGVSMILCLMGREAAAACRAYGYEADAVPNEAELERYLRMAPAYEINTAMDCLNAALMAGNRRDFDPDKAEGVDIDTLELKKN